MKILAIPAKGGGKKAMIGGFSMTAPASIPEDMERTLLQVAGPASPPPPPRRRRPRLVLRISGEGHAGHICMPQVRILVEAVKVMCALRRPALQRHRRPGDQQDSCGFVSPARPA